VKRSGRDEPTWVAIHKCMEAMLGVSLYSYLYLLCFLVNKSENKRVGQVLPGSRGRGGEVAQTRYTHVSKCKNKQTKKSECFLMCQASLNDVHVLFHGTYEKYLKLSF
jgi:hypothetical protein